VQATALVAKLAKGHVEDRLEDRLMQFTKPRLLIVEKLGYLPFEPNAAHLVFQLVSRRYEKGAMLVTSNRSVSEWDTGFGDPVVASAILDRLLHRAHVPRRKLPPQREAPQRSSAEDHYSSNKAEKRMINAGGYSACRQRGSSGCRLTKNLTRYAMPSRPSADVSVLVVASRLTVVLPNAVRGRCVGQ
jgi:hypothetical protein